MSQPFLISMRAEFDASGVRPGTETARRDIESLTASITQIERAAARNIDALTANFLRGGQSFEQLAIDAELAGRRVGEAFGGASMRELRNDDIQAYGRELDNLRAKFNPMFAVQQRFAANTAEINRAKSLGAISSREAADAIARETAAYRAATEAIQRNTVAANANNVAARNANNFATANVAAQFQDIGVTTAMGMNPMQIALQQGTQLSAALGGQGLTGTVRTLGAAVASVLSPVSLLTIGLIGVGSAGIQAFMSMLNSAEDATSALETHRDWLDEILVGYDAAREAALSVVEAASQLPQGVVENNLSRNLAAAMEDYADQIDDARQKQERLNSVIDIWITRRDEQARLFSFDEEGLGRYDALIEQASILQGLSIDADTSSSSLRDMMAVTDSLMNEASEPAIKNLATDIYNLAAGLLSARAEMNSTQAALAAMQGQAFRGLGVSEAIEQIRNMTPDLRTAKDVINDIFNEHAGQARTTSELQALADAAQYAFSQLDEQELQRQTTTSMRAYANEAERARQAVMDFMSTQDEQLARLRLETTLVGTSAAERARLLAIMEADAEIRRLGLDLQSEEAIRIRETSVELALYGQELDRINGIYSTGQSMVRSFLADLKGNLRDGMSAWDSFAGAAANAFDTIADRALQMAADGIWDMVFGAVSGLLGGGLGGGSIMTSLGARAATFMPGTGWVASANGNVFGAGNVIPFKNGGAFTNQVVAQPTVFPLGLMGEAGEEAIMPLARNGRGQLGVHLAGGGAPLSVSVVQHIDARGALGAAEFETIMKQAEVSILDKVPGVMRDAYRRAKE